MFSFIEGFILGLVAGLPLGPTSAVVVDTAIRRSFHSALFVGLGGSLVDLLYCLLATTGLGVVFENSPKLSELFIILGGVFLIGYGIITARSTAIDRAPHTAFSAINNTSYFKAFVKGVVISIANPALFVSWVMLAGAVLMGMETSENIFAGLGVGVGTFLWFLVIAYLAHKGRIRLGNRAIWIARVVGILILGYGIFLVGKIGLAWSSFSLR